MPSRAILFVCRGNICRSPMAEVIFRDWVANSGLQDSFDISSRDIAQGCKGLLETLPREDEKRG